MSIPLRYPDQDELVSIHDGNIFTLQRRPLASRWFGVYSPDELAALDSTPLVFAFWKNGWSNPSPPLGKVAWRIHADGSLEIKGHAVPGTSGVPAFTVPGLLSGPPDFTEPDHRPLHDISYLTDVALSVSSFAIARVYIDHILGDVTITFPAT